MSAQYDENELLRLLADRSTRKQAFTLIVKQYSEPIYWKVRHIVFSHDDTDDIMQNTFLKAWTNIDTFQGKARLSTWLYRIAINEALDLLRRRKHMEPRMGEEAQDTAERLLADDYFDGDQLQAQLRQAIASLPDVQRTVFTLRYYDEMKYSEMSQLLGTSEGALKASYHLAVKKIKDYFSNND